MMQGGVLLRASHRLSPPDTLKVQAVEQRVYLRVVRPATERFVLARPIHTFVFILRNSRHRRRGAYPPDPSRRTDEPGHKRISARRATDASRVQPLHRPLKFTQFRILVNFLMRTLRRPGLHPASVDSTRRSNARPPPAKEALLYSDLAVRPSRDLSTAALSTVRLLISQRSGYL